MKVFFASLGCSRNLVDSEVMIGLIQKRGHTTTLTMEEADALVINTCGFLEISRQESIDTIQTILSNKKKGAKVLCAGCMVQLYKDEIEKKCPGIHYFLGSGDQEEIIRALEGPSGETVSDKKSFLECDGAPRTLATPPHYAYLKIAEGCRKRCSYCIIPEIKGPLKSKPIKQVVQEMKELIAKGVFELILIAQDLGDYGKDLGFSKNQGLLTLLQELLKLPEDFRLRLLYVYPDEITYDLALFMKSNPRIIPYLDMPIQHISNSILKKMGRAALKETILSSISILKEAIPHITLRTSIIVGFPGESEKDFQELCQFIKQGHFHHVGFFAYSNEEKSRSFSFLDQVPEDVKEKRVKKLALLQKKQTEARNKKRLGTTVEAVIDGFHPETKLLMVARDDSSCPEVDPVILVTDGSLVSSFGKKYPVLIEGVSEYDLVGRVVKASPRPS